MADAVFLARIEIQQNVCPDQMQEPGQGWKRPFLVFSNDWKYLENSEHVLHILANTWFLEPDSLDSVLALPLSLCVN